MGAEEEESWEPDFYRFERPLSENFPQSGTGAFQIPIKSEDPSQSPRYPLSLNFTQADMELSFVDVDDVIDVNERLLQYVFRTLIPRTEPPCSNAPVKTANPQSATTSGVAVVGRTDAGRAWRFAVVCGR